MMLPSPPNGYLDSHTAASELRQFVDAGDFDMPVKLPKDSNPKRVGLFVAFLIESEQLIDRQLARIGQLMRFFDLRDNAEGLIAVLNQEVKDVDDWERSATAVGILGDMGTVEQSEQALHYFQYLSSHPAMQLKRLIDLYFHLPANADSGPITAYIEQRMDELKPKIDQSDDAMIEYYALEDLKDDRLPAVLKAKQNKHDVLALDESKKRRQQALRYYLQHETSPFVDLPGWGSMLLQRECNETEVSEMAQSCGEGLDIIKARAVKLAPLSEDDQEDESGYVTRCVHALEFYRGNLSEPQRQYATTRMNSQQVDTLQWEPPAATPA